MKKKADYLQVFVCSMEKIFGSWQGFIDHLEAMQHVNAVCHNMKVGRELRDFHFTRLLNNARRLDITAARPQVLYYAGNAEAMQLLITCVRQYVDFITGRGCCTFNHADTREKYRQMLAGMEQYSRGNVNISPALLQPPPLLHKN